GLVARGHYLSAGLLQMVAVALPAVLQERPGLSHQGPGELVPDLQHHACQRASDRRHLRALPDTGRAARDRPVTGAHERLIRAARGKQRVWGGGGGLGWGGMGREDAADADQLDRPQRRRGDSVYGADSRSWPQSTRRTQRAEETPAGCKRK